MKRIVVVGQEASASPDFSIQDLPGTSGRLDILIRSLRAALLVSHGIRRDTMVYLVLMGGPSAPRTIRMSGEDVRFLRPDERQLAIIVQKTLARTDAVFTPNRLGIAVANGGVEVVLADAGAGPRYVLDEHGTDVRSERLPNDAVVFVGDHRGFTSDVDAKRISVGPVSLHAEDAIAVLHNEWDRS